MQNVNNVEWNVTRILGLADDQANETRAEEVFGSCDRKGLCSRLAPREHAISQITYNIRYCFLTITNISLGISYL